MRTELVATGDAVITRFRKSEKKITSDSLHSVS